MKNHPVIFELEKHSVISIAGCRGTRVRCLEGSVWITEEATPKDIVLEAGKSYVLIGRGRAVLQAMGVSRLALEAAAGSAGVLALGLAQPERSAVHA